MPELRCRLAGAGRARPRRPGSAQGSRRTRRTDAAARAARLSKGAWAGAPNPLNGAPARTALPPPLTLCHYPAPYPRDAIGWGHETLRGLQ